jgi:Na+-driven multidrug efflux pump
LFDISVAEIPVADQDALRADAAALPPRPIAAPARNALLDGLILRTLLWLAWPNIIALSAGTCVVIAETSYIGRLGTASLAAMALVFPFVILTMTMSGGAMGGGVSSAIARALGAGDKDRANALAVHALVIGACFGLTFTFGMLIFGSTLILAGYGIGARLEFMLTSLAFAVGIASVPMVGMAIGAGRVTRARRIALIAGCVSFVSVGLVATVIAIFPDLWVDIFTRDPVVRAASRQYLATAAPMYAFIGLSISMYFSSQGAAKVVGPVLAQTARLVFVAAGGGWLSTHDATPANFFALAAASMVVLGVLSAARCRSDPMGTQGRTEGRPCHGRSPCMVRIG